jgi:hypothetical protein
MSIELPRLIITGSVSIELCRYTSKNKVIVASIGPGGVPGAMNTSPIPAPVLGSYAVPYPDSAFTVMKLDEIRSVYVSPEEVGWKSENVSTASLKRSRFTKLKPNPTVWPGVPVTIDGFGNRSAAVPVPIDTAARTAIRVIQLILLSCFLLFLCLVYGNWLPIRVVVLYVPSFAVIPTSTVNLEVDPQPVKSIGTLTLMVLPTVLKPPTDTGKFDCNTDGVQAAPPDCVNLIDVRAT